MRTSQLLGTLLLAIAATSLSASAAEPVVVIDGLSQPTGLAVREGPRGGVELAIAEAGVGRLTSVTLLGEERQNAVTLVEGLGAEPHAVAWAADGVLFAAGEKITAYACERPDLPAKELASAAESTPGRGAFTSLVATDRHVYALLDGGLWRSRRLAEQLTEARVATQHEEGHDEAIVGLALNPRGYLASLVSTRLGHELRFLDPERPEAPGDATPVTGLEEPFAMSYGAVTRPSEPLLYALQADGVYRIDAAGPSLATARRVAEIAEAKAMAFGPDGALYIVTADESRTGVVLRTAGEF
ncbi:hypothetical protein [Botrimarina mediterranea]|uniref:SMP-30/Gluconolaconase/LRE-like region n=1 Tax=Botrimarina mediterranea TaxID=2528022 RepID=A0A518K6U2_9BACT|nr:hypothetical protein [Botrimarina mediterranea]QDV73506.1 hypothetical protein Spa11_17030 [Botrimarina mediterranea]QDV78024.1 hypothetical protein K2D_16290 [Planctomycetes bacterium K2D]